jgi:hypothetical protein
MSGRWARRLGPALVTVLVMTGLAVPPAAAVPFEEKPSRAPQSTDKPQRETARPVSQPTQTCRIYGSSSGYGLLCSNAAVGFTLAKLFEDAGIDTSEEFCWDDPELPDGFEPDKPMAGPGRWWLHTCLSFDGDVVSRTNANLTYEFRFHAPGAEDELSPQQRDAIERVTGRGQIPFLQVQTSPISSPRVDQDVAFSMLCDSKVTCSDTAGGRRVTTSPLTVGGVTMHAELVHLRVRPEGAARPEREVNCTGAGLPRTAEQLDSAADDDPRVCRYRYERSSNDAGGGERGDRYPALVTAFWQIWYDEGTGPRPLGLPYEKTTVNSIRVTEVQTLVVS